MGVLSCDRKGCKNIMCNRHSHKYGYICYECFEELLQSDLSIGAFMYTEKNGYPQRQDRTEELEEEFPLH
jgi:hypothetical protein